MTSAEAKVLLPAFLDFAKTLQGDEKSGAQIVDCFFRALGDRPAWRCRRKSMLRSPPTLH